jgi:hypothetical protein
MDTEGMSGMLIEGMSGMYFLRLAAAISSFLRLASAALRSCLAFHS